MDFFLDNLENIVRILDETTDDTDIRDVEKKIVDLGFETKIYNIHEGWHSSSYIESDAEYINVYIKDEDDDIQLSISKYFYTNELRPRDCYRKPKRGGYTIMNFFTKYSYFYAHRNRRWVYEEDLDDETRTPLTNKEHQILDKLNLLLPPLYAN